MSTQTKNEILSELRQAKQMLDTLFANSSVNPQHSSYLTHAQYYIDSAIQKLEREQTIG